MESKNKGRISLTRDRKDIMAKNGSTLTHKSGFYQHSKNI